jgi:hypothetical protein
MDFSSGSSGLVMSPGVKIDNQPENAGAEFGKHINLADEPAEKQVIRNLQQHLEIGEIVIVEARYLGIRERPEKQVDLAHSPMPSAEERPSAARIKPLAGAR